MFLLSMEDQQKVLTEYQKEYGSLILEYNKCNDNAYKLLGLRKKAALLCEEIQSSTRFHKKFFTEENSNFAENMIYEIKSFIGNYLSSEPEDNIHLYFYANGTPHYHNFATA